VNKKIDTWEYVIKPNRNWLEIDILEILSYKDLLWFLIKRDFTTFYKQTLLGPIWFFLQPLITTIVFQVIFNRVAKIPTDGIPPFLFYMSGIIAWNYFANCLTETSSTFTMNADLFGKVYFPRIIIPLSKIMSGLLRFFVQLIMFLGFYYYYLKVENLNIQPTLLTLFYLPFFILLLAMLGLGMGMLVSSLTTKYRDLRYLVSFGTQLMMYASPIIYPLSILPSEYRIFIIANPITPIIVGFRQAFISAGVIEINMLISSVILTIVIFLSGLLVFNKVEKNFIDTV